MPTVLLADDMQTTLAVATSYLKERQFGVVTATTALETLRVAATVKPDLIILDYEMPGMKGDELCRRLKAIHTTRNIPVLIYTAHEDETTTRLCTAAGAAGVVSKGRGRAIFLDRVAEVIGTTRRRHDRAPCHIPAVIQAGDLSEQAVVRNLSASGFYLVLRSPLTPGTGLRVSFRIPDGGAMVSVICEIVRAETLVGGLWGYGVQMLEGKEDSLAAVRAFANAQH